MRGSEKYGGLCMDYLLIEQNFNIRRIYMKFDVNKNLFFAYVGLTASGYDMADKQNEEIQGLVKEICSLNYSVMLLEYFASARTNQFEVNPYWPKGSVISAACFFITDDTLLVDEFKQFLLDCNNMEVTTELIDWIKRLPDMIYELKQSPNLNRLWVKYKEIINTKNNSFLNAQDNISKAMYMLHGTTEVKEDIVFAPNLLQLPTYGDFVKRSGTLTVISTFPNISTMLHEYLHPIISEHSDIIRLKCNEHGYDNLYDTEKMKETGYLINDSTDAKIHVVEECFVRGLSLFLTHKVTGISDDWVEWNQNNGFLLVQHVYDRACKNCPTINELKVFISETLDTAL